MKGEQLTLHNLSTSEDYIIEINKMIKDLKKEMRKYPSGSLKRTPLCSEIGRLNKIKKRLKRESFPY